MAEWFAQASLVEWLTLGCAAVWALVKLGEWKRAVEARRNGNGRHGPTAVEAALKAEHDARRRLADEVQVSLGKLEVRLARGDVLLEEHARRLTALEDRLARQRSDHA